MRRRKKKMRLPCRVVPLPRTSPKMKTTLVKRRRSKKKKSSSIGRGRKRIFNRTTRSTRTMRTTRAARLQTTRPKDRTSFS